MVIIKCYQYGGFYSSFLVVTIILDSTVMNFTLICYLIDLLECLYTVHIHYVYYTGNTHSYVYIQFKPALAHSTVYLWGACMLCVFACVLYLQFGGDGGVS